MDGVGRPARTTIHLWHTERMRKLPEKTTSTIKDMVSTLGFPIVITIWLLYERWTIITQQNETLSKLTETINQNSEVVKELILKIGG